MSSEVTDSAYWDEYWSKNKGDFPNYNLTSGLFYSYDLLLQKIVSETRERLGKHRLQVIDCGCGDGLILRYLCERFDDIDVYGIEYSDAIHKSEFMVEKLGFKAHLKKWDMNNGMPEDMIGKFDLVLSFGLIEHFQKPQDILQIMKTLMTDGGCMLTLIPNFDGLYNFIWKHFDSENYSHHIPISKAKLIKLHEGLDLTMLNCIRVGNPVIPGIHNASTVWKRFVNKIIININGRIFKRLIPKQLSLEKSYHLSPIVACSGILKNC